MQPETLLDYGVFVNTLDFRQGTTLVVPQTHCLQRGFSR